MFPNSFSSKHGIPELYSCLSKTKPRCCSCDRPACHVRKDCCFDVDFADNPMPWNVYIEHLVAQRKDSYNKGICLPPSGKFSSKRSKIQHIYVINRCLDGSKCYQNHGQKVVGASGKFYTNQLCALCNKEPNFRFPELRIQFQEEMTSLQALSNMTELNIQTTESSAINCPYGELRRPEKAYSKCTTFEYDLCLSYVAVVGDARGGFAANPHCVKCLPFFAKPTVNVSKCDSLSQHKWTVDASKTQLLIKTNSSTATLLNTKNIKTNLQICRKGLYLDAETLSCHPQQYFNQFLKPPVIKTNKYNTSNQTINKAQLIFHDVSFAEFLTGFETFIKVWYPLLIPISLISLLVVIMTCVTIKGLQHPPGQWLLAITFILLFYFCLQFLCVVYDPPNKARNYIPILIHWCIVTKYLYICMLTYEFIVLYRGKQHSLHNVVVRLIMCTSLTLAACVICGWKDSFIQYGECLIQSFTGRLFVYWIPIAILCFSSLFALRALRLNIKQNASDALDKVDALLLLKAVDGTVRFLVIAIIIDTLAVARFDTTVGDRELYQLLNAAIRLVFCTLNSFQGLLLLVIYIKRKFIIMTYRKKFRRTVAKFVNAFCCECCFRYDFDDAYVSDDDVMHHQRQNGGLNTTRDTVVLSTARSLMGSSRV